MTSLNPAPAIIGEPIGLPLPTKLGGRPLMEALAARKSSREFALQQLDPLILSDLLWAACGINRRDDYRTAPSARNWQEIDVYVALARGLYLFDPHHSQLDWVLRDDIRALTGQQEFVWSAPVNLIYVADLTRMQGSADRDEQRFYAALDTGFIAQNVYLFCASAGLATVVRGLIDRRALALRMGLRSEQRVIAAQTVGYPAT
ncbi:SagB/ThcOx family dehydrogenase [Microvirga sp. 17 mud 1-3]|uniref:SagB/ThcOx family dehydrogenase n=1 Tax=Microvirga sp. 17 mud 1-3 TaxID=2082949 RepID=UPI000D6A837D|nr:SagB/ThcOx family dehydrogenase [Microvirga sp. 17 mud 1-3]AWM89014.1 nitroreductase [Microvirga sp. 17 mud 1-3]